MKRIRFTNNKKLNSIKKQQNGNDLSQMEDDKFGGERKYDKFYDLVKRRIGNI